MFGQLQLLLETGRSYDEAIVEMAAPTALIAQLLKHEPFIPFRMSLTSGHEHEVRNPELVRLTDSTVSLCTPEPEGLRESIVIALIHVVSITVTPPEVDEPAIVVDQVESKVLKKDADDVRR